MDVQRQYHGWERPFGLVFADYLKSMAGTGEEWDRLLVWVPSSRAGRHILSGLFSGEAEGVEAFHPPRLVTPARFVLGLLDGAADVAGELQCLLAWKNVLTRLPAGELEPVFPAIPEGRPSEWAYATGQQLMHLRDCLAEDNRDFQSVSRAGLTHDRERWEALARLEVAYLAELEQAGLRDPGEALAGLLATGLPELPCSRLLIAGILNLSRRQAACAAALAKAGVAVELHLPVPESEAGGFDEWGRPVPGDWDRRALAPELLAGRIQRSPEPRELVDHVLELGKAYGESIDALTVGACEEDLSRYLIERSRLATTPFYAPEGKALRETDWGRLVGLVSLFRSSGRLAVLFDLLNHSLFRDWAARSGFAAGRLQSRILELQKEQLLKDTGQLREADLAPSRAVGEVREFVDAVESRLLSAFRAKGYPAGLWSVLRAVAEGAQLSPESREVLGRMEDLLQDLQADLDPETSTEADYGALLDHLLANTRWYPEREAVERPVSGWLELPWETAPHLVILGLPDNKVPGPKSKDTFLTPSLCRSLGLYGPDEAAAFHAFRLRLILESRKEWGKIDLLLPDRGLEDDPVTPTRFLFLAEEADILGRVDLLLGERHPRERPLAAHFGTEIHLPEPASLSAMSVTAFRAWLANPFHFYLQYRMGWEPPEPLPLEMDARHFGTLAHRVMEQLNGTEEGARLTRESDIRDFLEASLNSTVAGIFGTRLPVALQIQVNSLMERLRAAAPLLAGQRVEGWFPEKVEWAFHKEHDVEVSGVVLRGKIDLLERNAGTGAYRIVDYKTSDKSEHPASTHLKKMTAASSEPLIQEAVHQAGEKAFRWIDLQLPLYQRAVEELTGKVASCAYFNLAKAVSDIRLETWEPGPEERASAVACAEAVIQHIRSGDFRLGADSPWGDRWLPWFGGEYEAAIEKRWRSRHMEEPA